MFRRYKPVKKIKVHKRPNIPRRLTGGLVQLYEVIRQRRLSKSTELTALHRTHNSGEFTTAEGFLELSSSLPLLESRYKPLAVIGQGTFSQLLACEDSFSPHRKKIALKVMNARYDFIGEQECNQITRLNALDPHNETHIVQILSTFYFDKHLCIVLELLDCSLLKHITLQPNNHVRVEEVRKIALQLVTCFAFLSRHDVIHADLKPENVLLTPTDGTRDRPSVAIKLIDFGNAMSQKEARFYFEDFDVQTLFYRAPEVLIGLPFGAPIDMWSLGCVLVELVIGKPLFSCNSNGELFFKMLKLLGPFPREIYQKAKFFKKFFKDPLYSITTNGRGDQWRELELARVNSIAKLLRSHDRNFVMFIRQLLEYDPAKRLTPEKAILHPFFRRLFPFNLILGPSQQKNNAFQMSPQASPLYPPDCDSKNLLLARRSYQSSISQMSVASNQSASSTQTNRGNYSPINSQPPISPTESACSHLTASSSMSLSSSTNSASLTSPPAIQRFQSATTPEVARIHNTHNTHNTQGTPSRINNNVHSPSFHSPGNSELNSANLASQKDYHNEQLSSMSHQSPKDVKNTLVESEPSGFSHRSIASSMRHDNAPHSQEHAPSTVATNLRRRYSHLNVEIPAAKKRKQYHTPFNIKIDPHAYAMNDPRSPHYSAHQSGPPSFQQIHSSNAYLHQSNMRTSSNNPDDGRHQGVSNLENTGYSTSRPISHSQLEMKPFSLPSQPVLPTHFTLQQPGPQYHLPQRQQQQRRQRHRQQQQQQQRQQQHTQQQQRQQL